MDISLDRNIVEFDCDNEKFSKIRREILKFHKNVVILKTSQLLKDQNLEILPEQYLIIKQDCTLDKLKNVVELLIDKYIYPRWINEKPICFISIVGRKSYFIKINNSDELHRNFTSAFNNILLENLIFLLENKRQEFFDSTKSKQIKPENELDPLQKEAVDKLIGIVKVLAPAGSGKTRTLVNRVINLLNNGAKEKRILAVAFNKKAMLEMQNRLNNFGINIVDVRTLHSIGYEIIKEKLYWRYQDKDNFKKQKSIIYKILLDRTKDAIFLSDDKIEQLLDIIRRIKLEILNYDKLKYETEDQIIYLKQFFKKYIEIQKQYQFLTFDDMIYFALIFLITDSDLREKYQNKYDFILVDEFQDLNQAQFSIIEIISMKHRNVFIVGDDDQLIYNWCGADSKFIMNYGVNNPLMKQVILNINYRSSNIIIQRSKWLIDNNRIRFYKNIKNGRNVKNGEFTFALCEELNKQCEKAVEWILNNTSDKKWNEYAILYRYNIYEVLLASFLDKHNIPHTEINYSRLFKTTVGNIIFAYFDLISDPHKAKKSNIEIALKKPNKYISRKFVNLIEDWGDVISSGNYNSLSYYERKNIYEFVENVQEMNQLYKKYNFKPKTFLEHLDSRFKFSEYFSRNLFTIADIANDYLIFQVICSLSENYSSVNEFYKLMDNAINFEEDSPTVQANNKNENQIILSSIHRTKGNEYKNVIYFNLGDKNTFESKEEVEDERRVVYVGITRAKDKLFVTTNKSPVPLFFKELVLNPKLKKLSTNELKYIYRKLIKSLEKKKVTEPYEENLKIIESEMYVRNLINYQPTTFENLRLR